jgi:hypothetical protein
MPNTEDTGPGGAGPDYADRLAASAEVTKGAWMETLEDAKGIAAELEADGWNALLIPAGHTAPENPDSGETDRFGLTHVVPDNYAEEFSAAFEEGKFPEYEVYQAEAEGRAFVVTALFNPESKTAILIVGSFELRNAAGCVAAAKEAGKMYTHVQTLDGTHLGSFEHEGYGKFFPRADRIENWNVG